MTDEIKEIKKKNRIIGRDNELMLALSALEANRHILFEGAVGVGKTEISKALTDHLGRSFCRIDGDEGYTEQKLIGWFDPPKVISLGYTWDSFDEGPIINAMKDGSILFINEINRMPEGTQNVLLPAMDERKVIVPKLGDVVAKPNFRIIATQNPEEFVGTAPLSEAIKDRFILIRLEYQTEEEERKIVKKETNCKDDALINLAVGIIRKTREHPDISRGSSIRGAIDLIKMVQKFKDKFSLNDDKLLELTKMALATKIEMHDRSFKQLEQVIKQIISEVKEVKEKSDSKKKKINL